MKKTERWRLAQKSEQEWWEKTIQGKDFSFYAAYAEEMTGCCRDIISFTEKTRVLEVGSGPIGIIARVKAGFRCGIDPLELFFRRSAQCRAHRDPAVHYCAAQSERLPFPGSSFDVIIIDNILDHCEDIDMVFRELKRVCAPGGIVYLRNFICTRWGILLAELLEFFRIDRGHPYHFRKKDLLDLFPKYRFQPLLMRGNGFFHHQMKLLAAKKMSHFLRAVSLSQADKMLFVLKNS